MAWATPQAWISDLETWISKGGPRNIQKKKKNDYIN